MAKLMSKKTREIVTTTSVLVLVAIIIIFYVVYPLIYVPDMIARPNREMFKNPEYEPVNDPQPFIEAGLNPDTLTQLTNDNIKLAALFFGPDSLLFERPIGTIILLHPDDTDRTYFVDYIRPLLDSGLDVIIYDQRASGASGGRYHFGGDYEGDDLVDLIANLNIHQRLVKPLLAVGFGLGGDAVINASFDEDRILAAIAIEPYLSLSRWIESRRIKTEVLAIPLNNMIYFWWFQKLTGYPFDRTFAEDLRPVFNPTDIYISANDMETDEIKRLKEISQPDILSINSKPDNPVDLRQLILARIYSYLKSNIDSE